MVLLAALPPQALFMAKSVIGRNPGALAAQARVGLARTFGLDQDDPLILAAALAGSFYVSYLAQDAAAAGMLDEGQVAAVDLIANQAMGHWKAALVDTGAVPTPEGWND